MKSIIIIAFLIGFYQSVNGQTEKYEDPGYDTNYIKSFRNDLIITAVSAYSNNTLSITDKFDNELIYATNLPMSFGLAFDYKWFTFEYTSSFGGQGEEAKGNTEISSLGFGLTLRKFWFRNFFQLNKGYYVDNPTYLNPDFDPTIDAYPHRPDLQTFTYFASINYGFNHRRFSNMASLWQIERQKKSAGSFTTGLSFALSSFSADSSIVPTRAIKNFSENAQLSGLDFLLVGLNVGYLHTFAMGKTRKWFISLALIPGISFQKAIVYDKEGFSGDRESTAGAQVETRFIVGWNGDYWYTTMSSVIYGITTDFSNNLISQSYEYFRFVVGYKIKMGETKSPFLKKIGL